MLHIKHEINNLHPTHILIYQNKNFYYFVLLIFFSILNLIYSIHNHLNIYDEQFHKSTKFASWNPVVGFMLYCIDNHMCDKLIAKKGVRPSTDPIAKGLSRTRDLLSTLYPIS